MRTVLVALLALTAFAGCLESDSPPVKDTADAEVDPAPEIQTKFMFPSGAGCPGDVLQIAGQNCQAFQEGPGNDGPDGFWVPLTADYVGLPFTSTVDNAVGDSDCFGVNEDGDMMATDFNDGQAPCKGVIPPGAAWLFVYSYAEPHTGITVTFTL